MNAAQRALLTDNSLSDAARILGLHIESLGAGDHELPFESLRPLLNGYPNRQTVGRHLDQLVAAGKYIERVSAGGRNHSPVYRWIWKECEKTNAISNNRSPEHTLTGPIDGGGGEAIGAREVVRFPVIVPEAEAALEQHDRLLSGGRGAIRDYLRSVVPAERQYAWVQDAASKINGLGFNWKGVPLAARAGLYAAAVNELLASGEAGYKYPPGDPRNARTKLGILVNDAVNRPAEPKARPSKPTRRDDEYDDSWFAELGGAA